MGDKSGRVIGLGNRPRIFGAWISAIVVGCVVLAGCDTEPPVETESQSFAEIVASVIADAEEGGAGDAQLEILRNAQAQGEVSLEDARVAARAMVQCVNDAGSEAFYSEITDDTGLVIPRYDSASDTDQQVSIAEACDTKEAFWVNMAYQIQPSSQEMNDAYLDERAPIVRSCLEREGYTTDPNASTRELLRQATQVTIDTDSAVNCLVEANIHGY